MKVYANKTLAAVTIIVFIAIFVVIGVAIHTTIRQASTEQTAERTLYVETRPPEDGKKIPLTQEKVNEDMQIYFENKSTSGFTLLTVVPLTFVAVGLAIMAVGIGKRIIAKRKGSNGLEGVYYTVLAVFGGFFAASSLITVLVVSVFYAKDSKARERAKTEDAKIEKVIIKDTDRYYYSDDEGGSTEYFYLIISYDGENTKKIKVTEDAYDMFPGIHKPDPEFYMATATDNKVFAIYSTDVYELK